MAWTVEQVEAAIKAGILKPHEDNMTPEQREAWSLYYSTIPSQRVIVGISEEDLDDRMADHTA